MLRYRAFITLAMAAGLLVGVIGPAQASRTVKRDKSYSAPNGAWGNAKWYADGSYNTISASADDKSGGGCTETWWDYTTKPHEHYNPGVFVNCSGSKRSISGVHGVNYHGINGLQVIVCSVPNTSGRITRNSSNCRGNIGGLYLHSGQRYSQFGVNAVQYPSGIKIYRA